MMTDTRPFDASLNDNADTSSISPLRVFLYVVSTGIVAGALEVAGVAWNRRVDDEMIFASWQSTWMIPISAAVIFLPLACALAVGARQRPGRVTTQFVIFASTAQAAFAVLFLFHPRLHLIAIALLAVGIASQAARTTRRGSARLMAHTPRIGVAIAGLTIIVSVMLNVSRLAPSGQAAGVRSSNPGSPNVLLLVLDTVRASSLSLYGYDRQTSPAIDRFARRGVTFLNAFSTSSWTLPSHSSMFTGRYPRELRSNWETPLDENVPTIAEEFTRRGYATGGFVANVAYTSRETGLGRGFDHYEDYGVSPSEVIVSSSLGRFVSNNRRLRNVIGFHDIVGRKRAADMNGALVRWLDDVNGRPFFAFVNYFDAHEPYLPPPPFDQAFGPGGQRDLGGSFARSMDAKLAMGDRERHEEQRAYDQSIAYLDSQLQVLFDTLERRGDLRNTIVVITSDHGEMFGEHGMFGHGNGLYLPTLHVPLVIVFPERLRAGVRYTAPVTLRDLPATLADLAWRDSARFPGLPLHHPIEDGSEPTSLVLASIEPTPRPDPALPLSKGPMRSLVADGYHYIRDGAGREELYDMRADPGELNDLSAAANLDRFRRRLPAFNALP